MSDPIKRIELKDGTTRYRFVLDVGRHSETGRRQQITKTYDTRREARAEYARIKHENDRGTFVRPSKVTVNEWLDEWLAWATRDVERHTARCYSDAIAPARERLGTRPLQDLTESDVTALLDWMLTAGRKRGGQPGTGLSVRSARLTLGRLKAALNEAVRRGVLVRNAAQFVTVPRSAVKAEREARGARPPWTEAEAKTFLAGIRDDRLHPVMLMSLIGLRPAEVVGMRWSDIDLDAGTLTVNNTRTLVAGVVDEKAAKSEAGERTLPLPRELADALRKFRKRQAAERLAAGEAYRTSGYVVVDELGQPVKTDWLRRKFYKLTEQVGVRKVRAYDARHSCLTYLATRDDVPDVVVSAWAGHADLSFTKRVYVKPDASHLKVAADRLDLLFG